MNSRTILAITLTGACLFAGQVMAEGGIKSRNAENAYNDMMRDWSAKPSDEPSKNVTTRSEEAAHADLMRDWNAKMAGEPPRELHSKGAQERYMELMRGTFPLSNLAE